MHRMRLQRLHGGQVEVIYTRVSNTKQTGKTGKNWRVSDKSDCSRCSENLKHTTWDLWRRPFAAAQTSHTERWSGESLKKSWLHCLHHSEAFKEKESLGLDFPFPKMIFCSSFCCFCRSCSNFIRSSWIFLCSSTIRSCSSASLAWASAILRLFSTRIFSSSSRFDFSSSCKGKLLQWNCSDKNHNYSQK